REVMNLLSNFSPVVEQNSIDEAWLDMTGCEALFGEPSRTAACIMAEIQTRLGLWCSIGISENKFLSKMAADMKKPLGITELWIRDIPEKLWPLPVKSMYGVGAKTAEKLTGIGIQTIGALAGCDKNILVRLLGKYGSEIHDHANGRDDSPVQPRLDGDMKSIGRETTLSADLTDAEKARVVLMELADDVGMTARRHGKKGCTVQLILKYSDFKIITRQTTLPATAATQEIYLAGLRLLEQNWDPKKPVRLIGISLSGFVSTDGCPATQLSLFDSTDSRIDQAMDKIRSEYGTGIITRAALLQRNPAKSTLLPGGPGRPPRLPEPDG
ncbi:MAG TPA: DNA polymerase IV, partial [Clostridiales bacterium]|nr:DNA polymerase IV [Clostridiales bacterium]